MEVRFIRLVTAQPKEDVDKDHRLGVQHVVEFSQFSERPSFIPQNHEPFMEFDLSEDNKSVTEFRINFTEFRREAEQSGGINRRPIQEIIKSLSPNLSVSDNIFTRKLIDKKLTK